MALCEDEQAAIISDINSYLYLVCVTSCGANADVVEMIVCN